jgi:hypothetical protein
MSFSNLTKSQARLRQRGKCAQCGESLNETEEAAHYLLRESSGGEDKEQNCIILGQNCHSAVHGNANFHTSYITPVGHFPYANIYGGQKPAPAPRRAPAGR